MGKIAELWIHIGAKTDNFTRKMSEVEKATQKIGRKMSAIGKNLTMKVTLPIVALGVVSVKAFGDFDKAMTESLAIMGDVSNAMRRDMVDAAKEVSKTTTFAAKEAAEAYFFLASAGLDAAQSIKVLPVVSKFAQAGAFDLATATDLLTDAQTAMGLSSKDVIKNQKEMIRVSDVLVGANTLANASVRQFSEALTNRAAAALTNVNKSLEEGVAVLAAFADKGVKGQIAGTRLAMMLNALDMAARNNKKAWDDYGISLFDAQGEMRGMGDLIGDLENLLGDMTTEQKAATLAALGFTVRTKASILTLMGSSEKIKQWTKDLKNMGGITEEVSKKQLQAFSNQMKLLRNQLVNVGIQIGEILAPIIKDLVDRYIKPAVEWFGNLSEGTKKTIVKIAGLVAAAGPLMMIFGKLLIILPKIKVAVVALGGAFKALLGPIGAVTAAAIYAHKVIKNLIKAKEQVIDADYRLFEAEDKLRKKLKEATDAAGLTRIEYNKLERAYDGNVRALAVAIVRGKEGKELQEALAKAGKKHTEIINEQRGAFEKLGKSIEKDVIPPLEEVKEKTEEFSETIINTVIPAMRKLPGVAWNTQEEVKSAFFNTNKEIKEDFEETTETITIQFQSMTERFVDLAMNMGDAFGNFAYGVMDKGSTLGENLKGLWTDIGNSFKSMVAEFIADEMKKLFLGIVSKTKDMATSITSGLAGVGKAISGIGAGIATLITTLATAIATAATTLAAAAPAIAIVLAMILATVFALKLISSLFKKKAETGSMEAVLKDISYIQLAALLDKTDLINYHLAEMFPKFDYGNKQLALIVGITGKIRDGVNGVIKAIKAIPKAQHGAIVTRPQLIMAGESGPEAIIPLNKLGVSQGAAGGQTTIIAPVFNISAMDAIGIRDFMRTKGLPEIIEAVNVNYRGSKTRLKEAQGI